MLNCLNPIYKRPKEEFRSNDLKRVDPFKIMNADIPPNDIFKIDDIAANPILTLEQIN